MTTEYGTERSVVDIPQVVIITPGKNRGNGMTESNELLASSNGNEDIRMKDFGRIDSEEDILGEYGDCSERIRCLRYRTGLEKFFILFVGVLLIIVIALSIVISNHKISTVTSRVCNTRGCVEAAHSILSAMDPTADPCSDFYLYACGGWDRDTPIPPGYPVWDRFQELSYKNLYHLKNLLENLSTRYSSGRKAQQFYRSCMQESRQERSHTLYNFFELMKNVTSDNVFASTLENVHLLNVWPIFSINVGPNERKADMNIIKIDYGSYQYPFGETQQNGTSSADHYLRWTEDEVEKRYLKDTKRVLKTLWNKTDDEATALATELMTLEKSLAQARDNQLHIHNRTMVYNILTIDAVQRKCAMINWILYLDVILEQSNIKLSMEQELVILHEEGFFKMCNIIHDYQKQNKTDLLITYLAVHLSRSLMTYFDAGTFEEDLDPSEELEIDGEHWRRCVFYTNKAFGFVTGAMYVNGTSKDNAVGKIRDLVSEVKETFKDYLLQKHWLDSSTRRNAEEKIDEMLEKISYPDEILKTHFLDEFYKDFVVGDDWFTNIDNMNKFNMKKMTEVLGKPVDRKQWMNPPVTVESDYSPVRNDIIFPIAMFHLPFYANDGPQALNFGAMGTIIGHEITHAFDITGRQYDGKGKLKQWWGNLAAKDFRKTTNCMKEQYDRYNISQFRINGDKTLDENIADNGGLRAAYIAYQLWERKNGESPPLPGLSLSNKQLFFISYAQMFCSKWKPHGLKSHIIDDKHSPWPVRVQGVISNSNTFADLFSCPFISKYNPSTKCEVW